MSSPKNKVKSKQTRGVDALLTTHGKSLAVGQALSIRLIKGPAVTENPDPVDPKAPHQQFPILAKFPVSVVKPDFLKGKKRLYQQDVPKAAEDSDEEAAVAEDGQPKKRWKSRRKEVTQRQWILQDEVGFLETMLARREKQDEGNGNKNKPLSTRYEGEPETNTSHYIVLRLPPEDAVLFDNDTEEVFQDGRCLQACPVPTNAMVAFAQPDARKTFSLSQAERVIEDQRNGVQTMHHLHDKATVEPQTLQQFLGRRRGRPADPKPHDARSRLLSKFQKLESSQNPEAEMDDGDDVMADVAYRNRKGAGTARKELLETVGDSVKVSDEGVLGGANDAMFGGRQRFGQFKTDGANADPNKKMAAESAPQERGADGAAMADDFYSRDVEAEYDALDYDANELFEDDDVDHGEKDVDAENDGMVNLDEDEEDDEDEDEEDEEEGVGGAAGLASAEGFKKLLDKAIRGETQVTEETQANGGSAGDAGGAANGQGRKTIRAPKNPNDHKSKLQNLLTGGPRVGSVKVEHEEGKPMEVDDPGAPPGAGPAAAVAAPRPPAAPADAVSEIGPDGLRVLTLDAVRREIWLNHGSMEAKRLMKIFGVKKKLAERKAKFNSIVKELCTIQQDAVKGNMLVLKQHWSHMG